MERQVGFEFGIVRFFLLDNQEITFLFFLYTLDSTLRWAVLSSESPDGTGGLANWQTGTWRVFWCCWSCFHSRADVLTSGFCFSGLWNLGMDCSKSLQVFSFTDLYSISVKHPWLSCLSTTGRLQRSSLGWASEPGILVGQGNSDWLVPLPLGSARSNHVTCRKMLRHGSRWTLVPWALWVWSRSGFHVWGTCGK